MTEQEQKLKEIGLKADFDEILAKLQLTDRQTEIFVLRYARGLTIAEIAEEITCCSRVIGKELKIIRHKMAQLQF